MNVNPRRVLVIGARGQDGTILTAQAVAAGDHVVGVGADGVVVVDDESHWSLLPARAPIDDAAAVDALIEHGRFDEIHYLAAHHDSSERMNSAVSAASWDRSWAVHCAGLLHVLDAVLGHSPQTHVVYASSSHAFGVVDSAPQNEHTPLRPTSPYGVTKVAGMHICAAYRARGARVSAAILYNHESPLRRATFVSQRIATAVAQTVLAGGAVVDLELRDPDAVVDWLGADDTVAALRAIAGRYVGEDFVVASGVARTVRDFAVVAAASRGLTVSCASTSGGGADARIPLVGDASRLRAATGWTPQVAFADWVGAMVDAAIARLADTMHDNEKP